MFIDYDSYDLPPVQGKPGWHRDPDGDEQTLRWWVGSSWSTEVLPRPSTERSRQAMHGEPIWRERSDFIIAAEIEGMDGATEQLWARRLDQRRFEICCIPFFVYDLALADVVEIDDNHLMTRVVEPSGRCVFRVWFGDSFQPRGEVAEQLTGLGALVEWSSINMFAVDAVDRVHAQRVADFLQEREQLGHFIYENGKLI